MSRRTRIGIFGGTFDPIHIGHVTIAEKVLSALDLDEVLLVVAGEPWQKVADRDVTPAERRFAAVAAAVESRQHLTASRIEIDRSGPSYMADTLRELTAQNPDADFFLIVGADTAAGLDTWKNVDEVARLAELVVVNRPGAAMPDLGAEWRVHEVEIPEIPISSSELRERIDQGLSVAEFIPPESLGPLGL